MILYLQFCFESMLCLTMKNGACFNIFRKEFTLSIRVADWSEIGILTHLHKFLQVFNSILRFFLKRMMEIGLLVLLERASIQVNSTELDQRYWFSLCYTVISRIQIRWMIECRKKSCLRFVCGLSNTFWKIPELYFTQT